MSDNPSDSFSPQIHDEAAGGCREARRLLEERRSTSPLQLQERSPQARGKRGGGGGGREKIREGERWLKCVVQSRPVYQNLNISGCFSQR